MPHQLVCHEDSILVANSGRNCLTVVKKDDLSYRHHWFDDARIDRDAKGRIGCHYNSVYGKGDRVFLVAHNGDYPSFVLELSWPDLSIVRRIDTHARWAHCVWPSDDGRLIVCNSKSASVDDVASGEVLWQCDKPNEFTRGLAAAGGLVFVGRSQLTARGERAASHGGIWVLDRRTWKEVDFIPMKHSGNIHEVRILDQPDECHHGVPFTGVLRPDRKAHEMYAERVHALESSELQNGWRTRLGSLTAQSAGIHCLGAPLTLATLDGFSARNVRLRAELGLPQPPDPAHIGIAGRYKGAADSNMYVAMVHRSHRGCAAELWINIDGNWTLAASAPLALEPASLTFELEDSELRVLADDQPVIRFADGRLSGPGEVGVRGTGGLLRSFSAAAL